MKVVKSFKSAIEYRDFTKGNYDSKGEYNYGGQAHRGRCWVCARFLPECGSGKNLYLCTTCKIEICRRCYNRHEKTICFATIINK